MFFSSDYSHNTAGYRNHFRGLQKSTVFTIRTLDIVSPRSASVVGDAGKNVNKMNNSTSTMIKSMVDYTCFVHVPILRKNRVVYLSITCVSVTMNGTDFAGSYVKF